VNLGGSFSLSMPNWFSTYDGNGVYDRLVRISDFGIRLSFPELNELLKEDVTGIKGNVGLSTSIPLSISSRQQNRITNLGLSGGVNWSTDHIWKEAPWGSVSLGYAPRVGFNFYSQVATTIPCVTDETVGGLVADPLAFNDLVLSYGRNASDLGDAELLPNGECVRPGRQGLMSLGNSLSASWNLKEHSLSTSVAWSLGFMRPLTTRPELTGRFASDQNFNENMSADLSYSYDFSSLVGFNMNLSTGIATSGSVFVNIPDDPNCANPTGPSGAVETCSTHYEARFPFPLFDYRFPGNGMSSAFVSLSMGI
jgi:hypothetical protein